MQITILCNGCGLNTYSFQWLKYVKNYSGLFLKDSGILPRTMRKEIPVLLINSLLKVYVEKKKENNFLRDHFKGVLSFYTP